MRFNEFVSVRRGGVRSLVIAVAAAGVVASSACATLRPARFIERPTELVGEWVDVDATTPADTVLWLLRDDGYVGTTHLLVKSAMSGAPTIARKDTRVGQWYLHGKFGDASRQEICYSRRLGRDGATCVRFSVDTVTDGDGVRSRLSVHGLSTSPPTHTRVYLRRAR